MVTQKKVTTGRISHDIEKFLRNSIELSSEVKRWSALHKEFAPLSCREVKGCKKTACPAYNGEDYRCWLVAGTLCKNQTHGDFAKKYGSCFKCDVFRIIEKDPIRRIYEDIDILIFHLQDRASRFRKLALIDSLTGLYNRHFFNEIIEREMSRAGRKSEIVSFMMMDIDNFKDVNDTLGHLAGDSLLVETGTLLKETVRKSDLVFRFGGDEFLVLMANADCCETENMVSRLLKELDKWNDEKAASYGRRLSLSIGCATCAKNCDIHDALNEADAEMYANKKGKKNNVYADKV